MWHCGFNERRKKTHQINSNIALRCDRSSFFLYQRRFLSLSSSFSYGNMLIEITDWCHYWNFMHIFFMWSCNFPSFYGWWGLFGSFLRGSLVRISCDWHKNSWKRQISISINSISECVYSIFIVFGNSRNNKCEETTNSRIFFSHFRILDRW